MTKLLFILLFLFVIASYAGEAGATTEYDTVPGRDMRMYVYVPGNPYPIYYGSQMNGLPRPMPGDQVTGIVGLVDGPWLVDSVMVVYDMARPDGTTIHLRVKNIDDFR